MTIIDQPQAPIDPAVERSRAVVDALGRLAVIITNHPDITSALTVEARVHCHDGVPDFDAAVAALGDVPIAVDDGAYIRRKATLGPRVSVTVWKKGEPCPSCGR